MTADHHPAGPADGDRVGLLLIRVWRQSEAPMLRARITQRLDVRGIETPVAVAHGKAAVLTAVESWLERFSQPGPSPGPTLTRE